MSQLLREALFYLNTSLWCVSVCSVNSGLFLCAKTALDIAWKNIFSWVTHGLLRRSCGKFGNRGRNMMREPQRGQAYITVGKCMPLLKILGSWVFFWLQKVVACGIYSIRTYRNNQPTCIIQCRLFINTSQDRGWQTSPKYTFYQYYKTLKSKTFSVFKKNSQDSL